MTRCAPALRRAAPSAALGLLLLLGAACGREAPPDVETTESPTADHALLAALRAERDRVLHRADGAGRAWLEEPVGDPPRVRSAGYERFTIVYEAGPLGVAQGGAIVFHVPLFYGWSDPQIDAPERPGYTLVETDSDVFLQASVVPPKKLRLDVVGGALAPGERLRIVYGAGPKKARADRFAEDLSRFWIAVDGDGDGAAGLVAESPGVGIVPGPPAQLVVTLPSVVRPGDPVPVTLALLDAWGNTGVDAAGRVALTPTPGLALPEAVRLEPGDGGRAAFDAVAREAGTWRVEAAAGRLRGRSNPVVVSEDATRVLWGDLHGHTILSDGTGSPEDYFTYARDVAGLDVVALTDHDHHGAVYLDEHPENWERIRQTVARFHEPGRFVTILGYEWTSWLHGHRHVLYFDGQGDVRSFFDRETDTPRELWAALAGRPALTFAHHSAGGPMATNWEIPPDPVLEPLTEIASIHGSSEASDAPKVLKDSVAHNFVRDALDRGYRLGFVGSGDTHNGHPGLGHLRGRSGGLAAILADELSREAVLAALRDRRAYATNGPRILLRVELDGEPMGSTLPAPAASRAAELSVRVVAPEPLERVDLVRGGGIAESVPGDGRSELAFTRSVAKVRPGDYLYVRAVQRDGGAAWSSPFFFDE